MSASVDTSVAEKTASKAGQRPASPGRPPAAALQARHERLMEIATREFLTHGYEAANIARIAKTAGISPKTVYSRYANKDELLLEVVAHLTAASKEILARDLDNALASPEQGLTAFALRAAHHWTSEREFGLYRLIITEAGRFPHLVTLHQQSLDSFRSIVTNYLNKQVENGQLIIRDTPAALNLLVSVTTGPIRERMLLGERPSTLEIETGVKNGVQMFLAWCTVP